MRLSKRIATTGLAVVMALSMLTACGGGGSAGGNSNNPSSKPNNPSSSVTGNENNGNGNTNNNGNTAGGSAAGSVWINTQTYKANQILKGNKEYLNSEWSLGNDSILYEYSQNAQKSYMKERYYDNGVEKRLAMLAADGRVYIIEPKAVEGKNVILLASVDDYDQQEMMKQAAAMKTLLLQLLTPDNPSMITVEPQKQLGTSVYHAESYTKIVGGAKTIVTGYYQKDTLRFLSVADENKDDETIKIKFTAFTANPNEELLKVPTNCEFATKIENGRVYDESGNDLGEESAEMKDFLA